MYLIKKTKNKISTNNFSYMNEYHKIQSRNKNFLVCILYSLKEYTNKS